MPSQCTIRILMSKGRKEAKGNNMVLIEKAHKWNSMDFIQHPQCSDGRIECAFDQMDLQYGVNTVKFFIVLYTR